MKNTFKLQASKVVYQNQWIKVREDKVIRPGGKEGVFGVVEMISGVTVLALDSKKQVYLTKEYKYGIRQTSIELVSGGCESGERPLALAKRELKEEAGLEAGKWVKLGAYNPQSTIVKNTTHLFLALEAHQVAKPEPGQGEIIKIIKVPFARAVKMALSGAITHLPSCFLILKAEKYLKSTNFITNN